MPLPRWALWGLLSLLCWVGAAGVGYQAWHRLRAPTPPAPPRTAVVVRAPTAPQVAAAPLQTPTPSPTPLPASLIIQTVPFTIQAPFQNWDRAHQEYCEAAAVYMVGQYFAGDRRPRIPPAEAEAKMSQMVAWERASFPGLLNLPLSDLVELGARYYGLAGQVEPVDLETIQRHLAAGRPVLIPVMTHGGPGGTRIYPTYGAHNVYHIIVLVGYDAPRGWVYTNDAGLREGMGLEYSWSTLDEAISAQARTHFDQDGIPVPWQQGRSMLVFQPPPGSVSSVAPPADAPSTP